MVYAWSQLIMTIMIVSCWSSSSALALIYLLKFLELLSSNIWSMSSVAVALLIASIVKVRLERQLGRSSPHPRNAACYVGLGKATPPPVTGGLFCQIFLVSQACHMIVSGRVGIEVQKQQEGTPPADCLLFLCLLSCSRMGRETLSKFSGFAGSILK